MDTSFLLASDATDLSAGSFNVYFKGINHDLLCFSAYSVISFDELHTFLYTTEKSHAVVDSFIKTPERFHEFNLLSYSKLTFKNSF